MSARLRAVVVDDEPLAREALRLLIGRDQDFEVAGECSGVDAPELIRRTKPDILFLDIQMPELDGFGVIDAIGVDTVPVIIFVTAYDAYALKAFDVHAVDYMLKPFDDVRFAQTMQRVKMRFNGNATARGRFQRTACHRHHHIQQRHRHATVRDLPAVHVMCLQRQSDLRFTIFHA